MTTQKDNTNYITTEKKAVLIEELALLKSEKRKEIIEKLEYAKSLGDLSENAEYHQAREEQGKLEDRIRELEGIIKDSVVVEKQSSSSTVGIGSTVIAVREGETEKKTYYIVGSQEADMATGKISNQSPIGQGFYAKKKGDTAEVETPKGIVKYKIVDVS